MSNNIPKLVVAMDIPDRDKAFQLADKLKEKPVLLKIHWVLYPLIGHDGLKVIAEMMNGRIFLDFKMHDIPSVIAKGVENLMQTIPFELMTLHTAGGVDMMKATSESRDKCFDAGSACKSKPSLLGVTLLTSLTPENISRIGFSFENPVDGVLQLAGLANEAGLDGVVSSVHELKAIKEKYGSDFKVLTPGIRPVGASADDQARVATPAQAKEFGSDYIVVGRPITRSDNPVSVVDQILHELES